MKKLSILIISILILSALLSACGEQQQAQKIRIALILPSTVDDLSWSQGMTEGVKAVQAELGGG